MLSSALLLAAASVAATVVLLAFVASLQRCPHCRRLVRRSRSRRWLRCRHCGRQYNRTIRPLTS